MDKLVEIIKINYHYICVEGVIGAGKTTLATQLSRLLNCELLLEQFETNPFLEKFYDNPQKYAFETQIYFLLSRFRQLKQTFNDQNKQNLVIADYCFCKDRIFASINLLNEDLTLYHRIEKPLSGKLIKPDLVIYLDCDVETLMRHIRIRARSYETEISVSYLNKLITAYNDYVTSGFEFPVLNVNMRDIDLIRQPAAINKIVKNITKLL